MNKSFLILWGYFVELILSALILLFTIIMYSSDEVVRFVRQIAIDAATLICAVILAASAAFLWSLYSNIDSEFREWLDDRGALSVYWRASEYCALVSGAATIGLIITRYSNNNSISIASAYLLILTIINAVTLTRNALDLLRLNANFKKAGRN